MGFGDLPQRNQLKYLTYLICFVEISVIDVHMLVLIHEWRAIWKVTILAATFPPLVFLGLVQAALVMRFLQVIGVLDESKGQHTVWITDGDDQSMK